MLFQLKSVAYLLAGALAFQGVAEVSEQVRPGLEFFNQQFWLVLAHGIAGGACRWLFLREPWRDGLRLMVLGGVLAAGVGNLWRLLVREWVGDVPESLWSQPETAYSGAFLVGLLAVTILGRFVDQSKQHERAPDG